MTTYDRALTVPAVRRAITDLQRTRIHPFFLAYLVLRRHAIESGSVIGLTPRWLRDLAPFIRVEGAPHNKPYYRPLSNQQVSDTNSYWLNRNLAGSFAPSSLRGPIVELATDGQGNYELSDNHEQQALDALLYGQRVDVVSLAAFLLRDFGFELLLSEVDEALVIAFRSVFRFDFDPAGEEAFEKLFFVPDDTPLVQLFEPLDPPFTEEGYGIMASGVDAEPLPVETSREPIRSLSVTDLGIGYEQGPIISHASNSPATEQLPESDPMVALVRRLLETSGGVIFTGPPGTGKSYAAALVAESLVDTHSERTRYVQFHASYQYEDFIEGFRPKEGGDGFILRAGHLIEMSDRARENPEQTFVLVVDELSRGDVGRVFGEALTYVEKSKRDVSFTLSSGREATIPSNLLLLCTMNPMDKGVDEVDAAFERRFAKIEMLPDAEVLSVMLKDNGLPEELRHRVLGWFRQVNKRATDIPMAALGQAYFAQVTNANDLWDLWSHQLKFHVARAFRHDNESRQSVEQGWRAAVGSDEVPTAQDSPQNGSGDETP
ncbi:McrB family protein [Arthrobacter bussei]|nr:AAA family ATPase [Arthrobacter bussei]